MEKKFNIFKEITKLYSIYLSKKDKNFNLKQIFEGEDFFRYIYPGLDEIIDYISNNKNRENTYKEEQAENTENVEQEAKTENVENTEKIENTKKIEKTEKIEQEAKTEKTENIEKKELFFEVNNYSQEKDYYSENVTKKNNVNKDNNLSDFIIYKNSVVKPLIKKIYKKLAIRCHPDKCNDNGIFVLVSECYEEQVLIGLIHFCIQLNIDLSFIEINNMFVEYLTTEIKYIINKILKK